MRKSSLDTAQHRIISHFSEINPCILRRKDLFKILLEMRNIWHLASSVSSTKFVNYLIKEKILDEYVFDFPNRKEVRFIKGNYNIYQILSAINTKSYFSHITAVFLNKLSEDESEQVFWNVEQFNKNIPSTITNQSSITNAFKNKARVTNNICKYQKYKIHRISGMYTDNLGVIENNSIRYTGIERTLIDIVVRPQYSGCVQSVLKVFEKAKAQVKLEKLLEYYKKLNYAYPYHQSLGFYLEKADYPKEFFLPFSRIEMKYDFYLENQISHPNYSKKWHLYYPPELDKI